MNVLIMQMNLRKMPAHDLKTSGAYLHVIYDPNDSKDSGVYTGTSLGIGSRVLGHITIEKTKSRRSDAFTMSSGNERIDRYLFATRTPNGPQI